MGNRRPRSCRLWKPIWKRVRCRRFLRLSRRPLVIATSSLWSRQTTFSKVCWYIIPLSLCTILIVHTHCKTTLFVTISFKFKGQVFLVLDSIVFHLICDTTPPSVTDFLMCFFFNYAQCLETFVVCFVAFLMCFK